MWATLVDCPTLAGWPLTAWAVSKTYREREELDQWVTQYIPTEWYEHHRAQHRYTMAHGAMLRNLSADDPDNLKQGKVDIVFYNEAQKMSARAIVHGLFGTADNAGLTLLTANPPSADNSRGWWMFELKDAIDEELRLKAKIAKPGEPLGAVYFNMSSKDNPFIDQPARKKVGRLAKIIDKNQGEADDSGEWKRPGDKALYEFDKLTHLEGVPQLGATDITRELAEVHEFGEWEAIAGIDFQRKPFIVSGILRCFGDPESPIYWYQDELVVPRCTVEEFCEVFAEKFGDRYTPQNLLWIGDASSSWQGLAHDFEGGERVAFDIMEDYGWRIIPPQAPKEKADGTPATGRGRNPLVDMRLNLANEVLRSKPKPRLFIDPVRCPWLAECAREATTKRTAGRLHLLNNNWAHAIDAMTYPIWRLEPRADRNDGGTADQAVFVKPRRPATW